MTGIHAFMTNRMKSDLRACGFSEEQLLELTPQEGDEILAAATSYDEAERKAEAQLFLDALAPGGRFMFQTFDDNAERKDGGLVRQLYGTLDEHWHELNELNNRGAGIFVTVNETDGKGRETANIVSIRANFIDQDGPPQPENPHLPVTITTETSPDHWHDFWVVRDCPLEQFTPTQKRLARLYNSDPKVIDRPRVMRVPGFFHRKHEPILSRLVFAGDAAYSYEQFIQALPPESEPAPVAPREPPKPSEHIGARDLNIYALEHLDWWAPSLFPGAKKSNQGWRVSSKSLGRKLEEDISLTPQGIVDFGVADMGDANQGRRTPIDLVMEWNSCDFKGAVAWLHRMLGFPAPVDNPEPQPQPQPRPQPGPQPSPITKITLLSQADFLAGFTPPNYLVDDLLQRRFIYSLTGVTGHGKTALALLLAQAVSSTNPNARFGPHAVENGRVVYFVGENPDDVRCRIIGANDRRGDDPSQDHIYFIVGVFDIAGLYKELVAATDKIGGVDLVLVDTSAAYFLRDDENSNPQMGEHARKLRSLTTLPGSPCVIPLCHPIKHVSDPAQLLPRGGGAFIAEMDGNLTAWKHDENLITFHHSDKFRGPGFEPITFKLEKITTPKLVDSKNREIPTVHAVAISEQEEAEQEATVEREEDELLAALAGDKLLSIADLARACGWLLANGEPHKSKTYRVLDRLVKDRLVRKVRGRRYRLTEEGRKAIDGDDDDDEAEIIAEERGGAPGGQKAKPFLALKGMKQRDTVPCVYCGRTGDVFKFADGRQPKGQRRHAELHEGCAEAYFTGKSKPQNDGQNPPESHLH